MPMREQMIFYFDIDGTLVDSATHIVPESTKIALKLLREQGHRLCIATGRSLPSVMDGGFHKLIDWDMIICNNGQAIYNKEYTTIHLTPIPRSAVYACIEKANAMNTPLFIMGEEALLTREANEHVTASHEFFKERIPEVKPYRNTSVVMMIAYGPEEYDYQEYREIEEIDVIPGQSTYADIVLKGHHKAMGIKIIADYFPNMKHIAFGDSLNDVEMLEYADLGIAMGNANKKLKSKADMITDDVSHNGIYNVLKKLSFI